MAHACMVRNQRKVARAARQHSTHGVMEEAGGIVDLARSIDRPHQHACMRYHHAASATCLLKAAEPLSYVTFAGNA